MGSLTTDIPLRILSKISEIGEISSLDYSKEINEEHQKVIGGIKSLQSLDQVISVTGKSTKCWSCTDEGAQICKEGSHEARLLNWLPKEGSSVDAIKKNFSNANVALGAALKNKWVKKDGAVIVPVVSSINDEVQKHLVAVAAGNSSELSDKQLQDYRKRKLIKDSDVTVFTVSKGPNFTTTISKQEAELTKEMIESGQWKNKTFKPFNFRAKGKQDARPGHLHPLMQLRSEFRQIFLEMGFSEMPTNSFVESAFWNFDALFQPQQHPARDAHDTFYVKTPGRALSVPQEYMERVRKVHSEGGYSSSGYRYPWSEEEAHKNLLRTHTTAVSARMLEKLARDGFRPAKYFSIDRVFRNETLDATHLAEFHQIEGVVADYNLSVKHLIGMFTAFFEKIGIKNLRFKSTYNPYTEPSMEIYSYHEGLGKWVEVGNSGLFRPEMLRPMGLPEDVSVLGWGLSLERPAMIMFGSNNIRELVGPRVKMELVYGNPICVVDKFQPSSLLPPTSNIQSSTQQQRRQSPFSQPADSDEQLQQLSCRQDRILNQLDGLQERVRSLAAGMSVDVAQHASAHPPRGSRRPTPSSPSCVTKHPLGKDSVLGTESCLGLLTGAPRLDVTSDVVVTADPRRPPHFLPPLLRLLGKVVPVKVQQHVHSSVQEMPPSLSNFLTSIANPSSSPSVPTILVRVIWSVAGPSANQGSSSSPSSSSGAASAASSRMSVKSKVAAGPVQAPRLVVSPLAATEIAGENNICRYLARLLELVWEQEQQRSSGSSSASEVPMPFYEGLPRYLTSECDSWLDDCQAWLITGSCRGRANFLNKLSNKLGETEEQRGCLLSQQPTLADVFVSSSLAVMGRGKVALNVAAWRDRCNISWGEGGANTS